MGDLVYSYEETQIDRETGVRWRLVERYVEWWKYMVPVVGR